MSKLKQIFTIPNILSFIRIGLIPFIVIAYAEGNLLLSAILLASSALTDIVDGFIARRFNQVSPLGKALDPIADKLTLLAVILCICFTKPAVYLLLFVFIIKEVLMGVEGLIIIKKTGTTYSARWYGKMTTVILYVALAVEILWVNVPLTLTYIMIAICIVAVIFSFVMYTVSNTKRINSIDNNEQK